jgi:uncharacterized protein
MAIAKLLIILVAIVLGVLRVLVYRRAGHSSLRALGISLDRSMLSDLSVGMFAGLAGVVAILALEITTGMSRITSVSSLAVLLRDWPTWIMVPLIEELVFRSAFLGGLLVILPRAPWSAILISAIVFGAAHALNLNATALTVAGSAVGAVAYGTAFAATGKVWLPIGLHFAWNYALGPLFGFPLSGGLVKQGSWIHLERAGPALLTGGSYGPEGGVTGLLGRAVVLALLAAWLWRSGATGVCGATPDTRA